MRLQKAHFEAYTAKAMLAWYCLSSLRRRVCRSGPVSGCLDSYSEPARWIGRRDGPLLDALRLSCKNLTQSTDVVDGDPCGCSTSVKRRTFKPAACAIDDRVGNNHRRASDDSCIGRLVRYTAMVASSVGAGCSSLPGPFGQRVKVHAEAFGIVPSHSVPAIDPTLGPRSQERDRIGANGVMVIRLRMPSKALAGSCRLQRRTRQRREKRRYFH